MAMSDAGGANAQPAAARTGLAIRPGLAFVAVLLVILAVGLAWHQPPDPQPGRQQRSLFDAFLRPIERNAALRLPRAPGALYGMSFTTDGQRGWVVGDGGAIIATRDGGTTWQAQASGVRARLQSVHMDAEGQKGWIVGDSGTVLRTENGSDWQVDKRLDAPQDLTSVYFMADRRRGWIVGADGLIRFTTDGGQYWSAPDAKSASEDGRAFQVRFDATGATGWIAYRSGALLRSTDGGRSWTAHPAARQQLNALHFSADGRRGWAVGRGGTILSTQDAGASWTPQTSGVEADLYDIAFRTDNLAGWVAGADGTVLATTDGGATWTRRQAGADVGLMAMAFEASGRRGWAAGSRGTIIQTSDGGRSWSTATTAHSATLTSVQFLPDGLRGWAGAADGSTLATEDGGRSWREVSGAIAQIKTLGGMRFAADGRRGVAVGDSAVVMATADGGRNWTRGDAQDAKDGLNALYLHPVDGRAWAVGDNGTILATTDGGAHWRKQPSGVGDALWSIDFHADGQRGWAVGGRVILSTKDGGASWQHAARADETDLLSVSFLADGRRGWIVGRSGTILATRDGGETWEKKPFEGGPTLWSVAFHDDNQRGWIAGAGGLILRTVDGGARWSLVDSQAGSSRLAMSMAADGLHGWVVGYPPPAVLRTEDGGQRWSPVPLPLRYARYPAPWFWAVLAMAGGMLWLALRPALETDAQGAAAIGASDAPTGDFARDRLEFGPLARGISRFLRNSRTTPPMTLAIVGDWGSGKSTLMELVCTDLRRYGSRPVWFNAWHHQNEEQLLAALLGAIRDKGLPPLTTLDGWAFRLRLLLIRSRKHFAIAVVALFAASALAGFLWTHGDSDWSALWRYLIDEAARWTSAGAPGASGARPERPVGFGNLAGQLAGAAAAIVALTKALKAFGADPAVLASATADKFRFKPGVGASISFRMRFAEQFNEVTRALPFRTVIVIDDLDRCRPDTVHNVMESVNFLVSSGKCFVIFGMATHRVQAALALSFDKIAKEMPELDTLCPGAVAPEDKERAERSRRLAYTRDYLEKLINLEIAVPTRVDLPAHGLLEQSPADAASRAGSALGGALRLWPLWLGAAAIAFGFGLGQDWRDAADPGPATTAVATAPTMPASAAAAGTGNGAAAVGATRAAGPNVTTEQLAAARTLLQVQPGEDRPMAWWNLVVGAGAFAAFAAGLFLYRLRRGLRQATDSPEFVQALRTWLQVVQTRRNTPRAIKRFGNRVRYLAMLQQGERFDRTLWQVLTQRLPRVFGARPAPVEAAAPGTAVEEHRLVALAAVFDAYGAPWRDGLQPRGDGPVETAVRKAIDAYVQATGASWPPSPDELSAFERALQGVRLSGDVKILDAHAPPVGASGVASSK